MSEKPLITEESCLYYGKLTLKKLKHFMCYTIKLRCNKERNRMYVILERFGRYIYIYIYIYICVYIYIQNVDQKVNF